MIMEHLQEHEPSTKSLKGAVYTWAKDIGMEGGKKRQKK